MRIIQLIGVRHLYVFTIWYVLFRRVFKKCYMKSGTNKEY